MDSGATRAFDRSHDSAARRVTIATQAGIDSSIRPCSERLIGVTACHAMMIEQKQQRPLVGDFGGVMAEATHRALHGRNRHRSDEGMHRKPGRSPLAALD